MSHSDSPHLFRSKTSTSEGIVVRSGDLLPGVSHSAGTAEPRTSTDDFPVPFVKAGILSSIRVRGSFALLHRRAWEPGVQWRPCWSSRSAQDQRSNEFKSGWRSLECTRRHCSLLSWTVRGKPIESAGGAAAFLRRESGVRRRLWTSATPPRSLTRSPVGFELPRGRGELMTTDAPRRGHQEEAHRGCPPTRRHQQSVEAREVDPARAPEHTPLVVVSEAAGDGTGGDLRADGGRPVRQPRPVPNRARPGAGAPAAVPHHRAARAVGEHDERGRAGAGARGDLAVVAARLRGERRPSPTRRSCSTATSSRPSTTRSPGAARCRWRRSGSGSRRTRPT